MDPKFWHSKWKKNETAVIKENSLKTINSFQKKDNMSDIKQLPLVNGAFVSLSLSMLLSSLSTSIANISLPTLAHSFAASFQEVQWVVLAYLLAITTLIVSVGRLGDIIGKKRLLLAGLLLFTAASFMCGITTNLWLLITNRVIQGFGAAIMMALSIAFVGETISKEKAGRAIGILGSMSAMGTALGPSLGGILISEFGWRAIFLVNIPLSLLTFILAYRFILGDQKTQNSKYVNFDYLGTLLLAMTLAIYAFAMTGNFGLSNIVLLLIAGAVGTIFVFIQSKVESPLISLILFRDPTLRTSLVMSAMVSIVLMTTMVVSPFYLSYGLNLNMTVVGIVMSVGPLVVALAGAPFGHLVDHFGERYMTTIGLIGIGIGALTLSLIPMSFGIAGYIAPIIIITLGYALFQTANNTTVMRRARAGEYGVTSGLLNLSRNLGLITGASMMGTLFAFATGTDNIATAHPKSIAIGMHITFATAAILIAAMIVYYNAPSFKSRKH